MIKLFLILLVLCASIGYVTGNVLKTGELLVSSHSIILVLLYAILSSTIRKERPTLSSVINTFSSWRLHYQRN